MVLKLVYSFAITGTKMSRPNEFNQARITPPKATPAVPARMDPISSFQAVEEVKGEILRMYSLKIHS